MEYQNAYANAGNAFVGGQLGGTAIGGGALGLQQVEPPRTIASAASRIDGLNERLAKMRESLSMISAQIGAMSSVGVNVADKNGVVTPGGAVYRLNDATDAAHSQMTDIENLIDGIGRALG
jgi:hypothetical protein